MWKHDLFSKSEDKYKIADEDRTQIFRTQLRIKRKTSIYILLTHASL